MTRRSALAGLVGLPWAMRARAPARSIGVGGPTGGGVSPGGAAPGGGISPQLSFKTRRALVTVPNAASLVFHGNATRVSWTINDISDYGGLWSLAAPTKLIIPAGWEGGSLFLWGGLEIASMAPTDTIEVFIQKNTVTNLGGLYVGSNGDGVVVANVSANDAAPVPGDFYELFVNSPTAGGATAVIAPGRINFFQARQVF